MIHTKRDFKEKASVLAYFQRARDTLLRIRTDKGLLSAQIPWLSSDSRNQSKDKVAESAQFSEKLIGSEVSDADLREFLKPVTPKSPEEALKIASQTSTSITLRKDRDQTVTVLRSEIDELVSTGKSLMPDELETVISHQSMADLLAFLQASATEGSLEPVAVRDFGTLPGLIEPAVRRRSARSEAK
ncbi:MAG TPA: hypothetical protein VM260_28230 [Pirellula sp.]|nr:hypothetical protein [Pirellula sp.]